MHCQECKEELLDLIYEEGIRPRRGLELLEHVDRCPLCHEEYATLLESRSLLQEWPDQEASWSLRVDPNHSAGRSAARWSRLRSGLRPSWPLLRHAAMALLAIMVVLAAAQSRLEWRDGGLTVQARLWKSSGAEPTGEALKQQELLKAVDQIIAESEQRQNQLFGMALVKMYEDLEVRHRYEHGEIQTAFERLQKQDENRWERLRQSSNQ